MLDQFSVQQQTELFTSVDHVVGKDWMQCVKKVQKNFTAALQRFAGFKAVKGSSPTPSVLTMMSEASSASDARQAAFLRLAGWTSGDVTRWLSDNGLADVQER